MSKLKQTLCLSAAAAIGAGITYYMLKKDELDIKLHASDLWDDTKDYGSSLVEKVDNYFDDSQPSESLS